MTAIRVAIPTQGTTLALTDVTAALILSQPTLAQISAAISAAYQRYNISGNPGFVSASLVGGSLQFVTYIGVAVQPPSLTIETLGVAVPGAQVLVDAGGGVWRQGQVVAVGTSVFVPGFGTIPGSARAALAPQGIVGGPWLLGDTVGGRQWFYAQSDLSKMPVVSTVTLSTVGALGPGQLLLVETAASSGVFYLVQT